MKIQVLKNKTRIKGRRLFVTDRFSPFRLFLFILFLLACIDHLSLSITSSYTLYSPLSSLLFQLSSHPSHPKTQSSDTLPLHSSPYSRVLPSLTKNRLSVQFSFNSQGLFITLISPYLLTFQFPCSIFFFIPRFSHSIKATFLSFQITFTRLIHKHIFVSRFPCLVALCTCQHTHCPLRLFTASVYGCATNI